MLEYWNIKIYCIRILPVGEVPEDVEGAVGVDEHAVAQLHGLQRLLPLPVHVAEPLVDDLLLVQGAVQQNLYIINNKMSYIVKNILVIVWVEHYMELL